MNGRPTTLCRAAHPRTRQTCRLLLDTYKHYFKTEDTTLMTVLPTTASREDQHFRIGNTGTDKRETRFVLHVTRAPAFSDKDNKIRTERGRVFSRTVLTVLPKRECTLFEQHRMIWAVCCQQLNVLFSLKCLLGCRVFRVLRFDQQASLTGSLPSLSEEHCRSSS